MQREALRGARTSAAIGARGMVAAVDGLVCVLIGWLALRVAPNPGTVSAEETERGRGIERR